MSTDSGVQGKMELWLKVGNQDPVQFCFEDQLREDSAAILSALKEEQIETAIISGDQQEIVDQVSMALNVGTAYGQKKPADKHDFIVGLKDQEHHVLMVGDGLNDAPVLAAADVHGAFNSSDIAQNTADIVFAGEQLEPVYTTLRLAQKAQRLVKQNFGLAIINMVIPRLQDLLRRLLLLLQCRNRRL